MTILGLIVEYNPFHHGHRHHLDEAIRLTHPDLIVAVMSGHFVQRGEPACLDKWNRTQEALDQGIDLVIELPFPFAVQSASTFANTAIFLLDQARVTDLVFGSESNDLETLKLMAQLPINVDAIKESLKQGHGFPKAYGAAMGAYPPNDILGIAYLKALASTSIRPHTIQRTNAYHSTAMDQPIVSATAIRKALTEGLSIDHTTPMAAQLVSAEPRDYARYYPLIRTVLLTLPKATLEELFLMDEGLENHLVKLAEQYADFDTFMREAITRRYTKARIQRTLTHLMVHTTKTELRKLPTLQTLRVLGFSAKGQRHLRTLRDQGVRVATRFNQIPVPYRRLELKATAAYAHVLSASTRQALLEREIKGPILPVTDNSAWNHTPKGSD
jgi:predicted nucleotidyltransferase